MADSQYSEIKLCDLVTLYFRAEKEEGVYFFVRRHTLGFPATHPLPVLCLVTKGSGSNLNVNSPQLYNVIVTATATEAQTLGCSRSGGLRRGQQYPAAWVTATVGRSV